jgi:uncharacterized protein (TIGR02466 family)
MNIIDNFAVPIYQGRTTGAEEMWELIEPKVTALWANPEALLPDWICRGVRCTTNPDEYSKGEGFINRWPEMKPIMDQIEPMVKEYYKMLNLDPAFEPYVDQMWVNNVPLGAQGELHDHPEYPIAGGFYFRAGPGNSILIEHPAINLITASARDPNCDDSDILKYQPVSTNDVLLWPGWLRHCLVANEEGPNRISCGFICLTRPIVSADSNS